MADRHKRTYRPTLRPDEALYRRAADKVRAAGIEMNDYFEAWLRWVDGETDEHPPRPGAGDGDPGQPGT
jgi:hypothetical protein